MVKLVLLGIVLMYLFIPWGKTARYAIPVLIAIVFHVLGWSSTRENYLLEKHGVESNGIVIEKNCKRSAGHWISYRFRVGSTEYEGQHMSSGGQARCEAISVGDQTFVTYVRDNPSISRPMREVDSHWFAGLLITAGCVGMLIWMNAEQTEFRRKKQKGKA